MDVFLYTASLSQKMSVDTSMGTPNILSLYCNAAINSTEFFVAVNSDPNVDVSTTFFSLAVPYNRGSVTKYKYPCHGYSSGIVPSMVSVYKEVSRHRLTYWSWHIQGYRFSSVGVEISPIKLLESILRYHWFPCIKIQLTLGYLLKIPRHSLDGL